MFTHGTLFIVKVYIYYVFLSSIIISSTLQSKPKRRIFEVRFCFSIGYILFISPLYNFYTHIDKKLIIREKQHNQPLYITLFAIHIYRCFFIVKYDFQFYCFRFHCFKFNSTSSPLTILYAFRFSTGAIFLQYFYNKSSMISNAATTPRGVIKPINS